ncbi:MAG: hypothetical protein E3J56_01780 [Candidatus Aminicenantes bacterium]|nr:MAG: hypothetical protein E3J56_01780 [Candidatus Aminicenantes bacterium]
MKDAQFKEVPYIRFRKSLVVQGIQQSSKPIGLKELEKETERSILIINSVHFTEFLNQCELEDIIFREKPWETTSTMKVEVARRLFSFTDKEIHILMSVVLAVFVLKIAKRTCKSGTA